MSNFNLPPLLGILPETPDISKLEQWCEWAIQAGVEFFQYRAKDLPYEAQEQQLSHLKGLCKERALLTVNDHLDMAIALDLDGVHLGQSDPGHSVARQKLGDKILGISTSGMQSAVAQAVVNGADYVSVGKMFDSDTKPKAPSASLNRLKEICEWVAANDSSQLDTRSVSVMAIGGITGDNVHQVWPCGVSAVAVCGGLFKDPLPTLESGQKIVAALTQQ